MKKRRETCLRPWGSEKKEKRKKTESPRRVSSPGQENKKKQKKTKKKTKTEAPRRVGPWVVKQKQKKFGPRLCALAVVVISACRGGGSRVWTRRGGGRRVSTRDGDGSGDGSGDGGAGVVMRWLLWAFVGFRGPVVGGT